MQLRNGKVIVNINSSVISEKHEVSMEWKQHTEWFSQYLNRMGNKLYEINDNFTKDKLMDKLRLIYEIFYNTNEYLHFVTENWEECYNWGSLQVRELLEILLDKSTVFKKQTECYVKTSIWSSEETWTAEDIRYVHNVLDELDACKFTCVKLKDRII